MKPFFVMLNTQNGESVAPLMDGEELAQFETQNEAIIAAEKTPLGENFGFEVFESGQGEFAV